MLSFFETLRVEVGSDVDITIVTSGFIESELTQGKFFTREGKIEVDQDMRDVRSSVLISHMIGIVSLLMCLIKLILFYGD